MPVRPDGPIPSESQVEVEGLAELLLQVGGSPPDQPPYPLNGDRPDLLGLLGGDADRA